MNAVQFNLIITSESGALLEQGPFILWTEQKLDTQDDFIAYLEEFDIHGTVKVIDRWQSNSHLLAEAPEQPNSPSIS